MAVEFFCFVFGSLILLIPGIWLAGAFSIGKDRVERWTYGSCVGLALAVYLASVISHFDLRWFYPAWGLVAAACFGGRIVRAKERTGQAPPPNGWILVILILVAVTRFGAALPQALPEGPFDPTFHLILAEKIRLAHHSISDWRPFESISLNYPTGSHVLLVVLAAGSRLPLETVFKDLIPLLGVLSTAQIYLLARRAARNESVALWSAAAYGLWAWFGSVDYYRWGGLPNELGMLFLLAMLTLWLDSGRIAARVLLMALMFAAVILVHNHVAVAGGLLLAALLVIPASRFNAASTRGVLAVATVAALALDAPFLVSYAMKITLLHSTTVLHNSEPPVKILEILRGIGFVNAPAALAGLVVWLAKRRPSFHPVVYCAIGTLAGAFLATEYFVPLLMKAFGQPPAIALAPSRFLTDLNYFLPLLAGTFLSFIQSSLKINRPWLLAAICAAGLADYRQWSRLFCPGDAIMPPGFVQACRWIRDHTPPSTVVLNRDNWTTYLAWRRATFTPLPDSEPVVDRAAVLNHLAEIMSGEIPPDSPDMKIVKIVPVGAPATQAVLWRDSTFKVIQIWPYVAGKAK